MAFPLAAVATGVNLLGSVAGLFGASSAEKRAERARQLAIQNYMDAAARDYSAALNEGRGGLYTLGGNLRDVLETTGRSLGSAMAQGGVFNSSATAGALQRQGASNAQALGSYQTGLTDMLARMKAQAGENAAQMQLGAATGDVNYWRQQQANTAQGIGSFLGQLGQTNLLGTGTRGVQPNNTGSVLNGNRNAAPWDVPSTMPINFPLGAVQNAPAWKTYTMFPIR